MGRPLFTGFLSERGNPGAEPGLRWDGEFESWDRLLGRGRERAELVEPNRGYVVDPTSRHEGIASFFAVATVPDTFLLWAEPSAELGELTELAPGLHEIGAPGLPASLDRPLWGRMTSGSSGSPTVPVGPADTLGGVALRYDAAVFRPTFDDVDDVGTLATCLPLQFSAAFYMALLPALFLRRDLLVFSPHDWTPLYERAQEDHVVCQSVPSVTEAGSLGFPEPVDMSTVELLLGAGYITHERVRRIRSRFRDVGISNIYGTAETGAISVDRDPGHGAHVGRPVPGKPVWIREADDDGVGVVATAGPDCRTMYWTPEGGLEEAGQVVADTDYGHFDDDGNLYLDGRIDAGEKLHGVMVYPRTVERHILKLDGVIDVRVEVQRESSGPARLSARVVGSVDAEAVKSHCRELSRVERPTRIECIDESNVQEAYSAHGKL